MKSDNRVELYTFLVITGVLKSTWKKNIAIINANVRQIKSNVT